MAYCAPGLDCAVLSCPSLSVVCPPGDFCGNWTRQTAADQNWVAHDIRIWQEIPANQPVPPWIQDTCPKGEYCPRSTMIDCPAGSWCPRGVNIALPCDALSVCGPRAYFEVNFVAVIISCILSAVVAAVSCTLRQRQAARARACRALESSASNRKLGASSAVPGGTPFDATAVGHTVVGVDRRPGIGYAVSDLSVVVDTKTILNKMRALIPAGAVTTLVGPSGCGKSTLLSALRGRTTGELSGTIFVNGTATSPEELTAFCGAVAYVPQEDILDRSLTPRELLFLSARLRSPPGSSEAETAAAVQGVIQMLSLSSVADVVIGGSTNAAAAISGGQLRRVSVGVELVGRPRALFLDEPTSGLDASSALDLMKALKSVAEAGVTVVAVLHQPRTEVWRLADHVIVMAGGGAGTIFEGAPTACVPYFTADRVGFIAPKRAAYNHADFVMDVATGLALHGNSTSVDSAAPSSNGAADSKSDSPVDLVQLWNAHDHGGVTPPSSAPIAAGAAGAARLGGAIGGALSTQGATFQRQMWLQCHRAFVVRLRDKGMLVLYAFLHVLLACALASGFSPIVQGEYGFEPVVDASLQPYIPPFLLPWSKFDVGPEGLEQLLFFTSVALGASSGIAASGLFVRSRPFLRREVDAGASALAFALGRMISDLLVIAWLVSLFTAVWMLFAPSGPWWSWLAVFTGTAFSASGIGYIAGIVLAPANAAMAMTIVCLISAVFAGIEPPLSQVVRYPVVDWAWYLSFGSPVAQAIYITYTEYWRGIKDVASGGSEFGFGVTDSDFKTAVGALYGIGFLWRTVAVLVCVLFATTDHPYRAVITCCGRCGRRVAK